MTRKNQHQSASLNPTDAIETALAGPGWIALENFFDAGLVAALAGDLEDRQKLASLQQAGTGRGGAVEKDRVRTDATLWLDGSSAAQRAYLGIMDRLRLALNERLYLGLFDYECHYAVYAPGGFYKKHRDALRGQRNRIVSCVTYLTENWTAADEGALALYDDENEDKEIARILPRAGTLALFLSEGIPHEVLPPRRARASIAGWFRCNASSGSRADPAA